MKLLGLTSLTKIFYLILKTIFDILNNEEEENIKWEKTYFQTENENTKRT